MRRALLPEPNMASAGSSGRSSTSTPGSSVQQSLLSDTIHSSSPDDRGGSLDSSGGATGSVIPPPPSTPKVELWSSVRLRIVGLCNLLGLLCQLGVGVGALLPNSVDGIMLEIIALNHFGLFTQGTQRSSAAMAVSEYLRSVSI